MFVLLPIGIALANPTLPLAYDRGVFRHPVALRPAARAMQAGWDVQHYDLDVQLDPVAELVTGAITVQLRALADAPGPLLLHADGPAISLLTVDGAAATWQQADDEVWIDPPDGVLADQDVTVVVQYTAHGDDGGGTGLFWGEPTYSLNEPWGARKWLVVYDDPSDKATATWRVTAPADLVVVTNGEPVSDTVDPDSGLRTTVRDFPRPIATYLLVVHAGDLLEHVNEDGTWPVHTWASPELIDQATTDFDTTGDILDHFSALWFDYDWPFYSNIVAPIGGAMEHTTATTFGTDLIGSGVAEWVNVHEVAHHWWGDLVTCATWEDIWLNEGFASYTEALWAEHLGGDASLKAYLGYQQLSYEQWKPIEGDSPLYDPLILFGGTVYDKGSLVLHMLRTVMGDDAFFQGLRDYGALHADSTATTAQFQAAMEGAAGQDLGWFFDQWVYEGGEPDYVVGVVQTARSGRWQVDVTVAQDGERPFEMPIEIELELDGGGAESFVMWVEGPETVTSLCLDVEALSITFDPGSDQLYGDLDFDFERFAAQADVCREGLGYAGGGGSCTQAGAAPRWLPALGALLISGLRRRRARR
jgi:aminopeptidase N